ncbi:1-phosphofructokinase family hexose kinase [Tamilnaduibacter salinus]|uniref:PfkB family carbohydrate kinase n=1 Tax=Tamilnaduibacter salinus TaxID=1484056 RepID=UPI00117CA172|nr:PfkB family carbohydrate kinase [Tamilnaduibacter salinus]
MADALAHHTVAVLSLNPAVDVTYDIPQLIADQKVRAHRSRFDPGGSGINVSRGLKRLAVDARTFCVIAGGIGRALKQQLTRSWVTSPIRKSTVKHGSTAPSSRASRAPSTRSAASVPTLRRTNGSDCSSHS